MVGQMGRMFNQELDENTDEHLHPSQLMHQIENFRCVAHKFGLVVKAGLKILGLRAGQVKTTIPPGAFIPTSTIVLSNGDDEENPNVDSDESDKKK